MAASLSLSRADVQTGDVFHRDASVSIRANRLRVRIGRSSVLEADVVSVQRLERRKWLVTLAGDVEGVGGQQVVVSQSARSCCGGR